MPVISVKALVLRRADYSDYDRMVTLFSPERGRIDAIARGCRKTKSPLVNAVEPFTVGDYQIYQRGERFSLEQCQILEGHYPLREDFTRLAHGAYWMRLLDAAVVPEQPAEELFLVTLHALAHLTYTDLPPELLTMAFEMHLASLSGMSPCMDSCMRCHRPVNGDARFDAAQGGVVCEQCPSLAPAVGNAARRIMMKLPRAKYDTVPMLLDHPEWQEAARLFRPYLLDRIPIPEKFVPKLP
jgi:DNA repair protein RecO (recombination protein O)